jgi:predicted enzyme related to lactoylglutathione lyase
MMRSYVTVDDMDSIAQIVPELGATVIVEPRDIPEVGAFRVIRDPQGAFIFAITYIENPAM